MTLLQIQCLLQYLGYYTIQVDGLPGSGDKVSHSGKNWTSTVDGNVWEPGVYGWEGIT